MPKDHGRRLWCDSGTCRFSEPLTSKSLMPLSSVIHWLHLCSFPFLSMASFWRWIAMHMLAQCLPGVAKSGTDVLETGTSCSQHKVLAAKVGPDLFQICSVGQPPDQNWSHEAEGTPLVQTWQTLKHCETSSCQIKAPHPHHHPRRFPKGVVHALSWPTQLILLCLQQKFQSKGTDIVTYLSRSTTILYIHIWSYNMYTYIFHNDI